ncbi:hypothetical protein WR25_06328 [Diploscapter pachys]|uniref:Uncharacterized protein n=1 Tax=Diploscapter pachys TaxID=2018661 RepID=A0A2A2LCI7_9BILA|nr:hypothetical protein WR25_06328 [Diploscapter pachys]
MSVPNNSSSVKTTIARQQYQEESSAFGIARVGLFATHCLVLAFCVYIKFFLDDRNHFLFPTEGGNNLWFTFSLAFSLTTLYDLLKVNMSFSCINFVFWVGSYIFYFLKGVEIITTSVIFKYVSTTCKGKCISRVDEFTGWVLMFAGMLALMFYMAMWWVFLFEGVNMVYYKSINKSMSEQQQPIVMQSKQTATGNGNKQPVSVAHIV